MKKNERFGFYEDLITIATDLYGQAYDRKNETETKMLQKHHKEAVNILSAKIFDCFKYLVFQDENIPVMGHLDHLYTAAERIMNSLDIAGVSNEHKLDIVQHARDYAVSACDAEDNLITKGHYGIIASVMNGMSNTLKENTIMKINKQFNFDKDYRIDIKPIEKKAIIAKEKNDSYVLETIAYKRACESVTHMIMNFFDDGLIDPLQDYSTGTKTDALIFHVDIKDTGEYLFDCLYIDAKISINIISDALDAANVLIQSYIDEARHKDSEHNDQRIYVFMNAIVNAAKSICITELKNTSTHSE